MTAQTASDNEPTLALPTLRLVAAVFGTCAASALLWMGAVALGPWGRDVMLAGPVGALAVALTGAAGVLVMAPWKTRAISAWCTMWLAATVLRMLLTIAAAFLLYSATPLSPEALCLAIAAAYLLALLSEAGVVAHRVLTPQ